MPNSGLMSSLSPPPHHGHQQPPFYSPPAPPPPHHGPSGGESWPLMNHNSNHDESNYHHHLGYNGGGDNNGNLTMNGGPPASYPPPSRGGGGGRTVSFSQNSNHPAPNNNPHDPNNNSGMMMMLLEEDGGGGPPNGVHPGGSSSDLLSGITPPHPHLAQRDLFEEIRNGGGHWSQLLRQVVLTPPASSLDDYSPSTPGGAEGSTKDDPMLGDSGETHLSNHTADPQNPNATNNGDENPSGSGISNNNSNSLQNTSSNPQNTNHTTTNNNNNGNVDNHGSNSSIPGHSNLVPLQIVGGSENGQFVYVGITNQDINRWITVGYLQPGDIVLEIQGQQVAGYTQADVVSLLHHCLRGNSATLTVAPRGSLGPELRSYLNTRFQKGSVDHALQGVVRDNLYLRTVPVTTRTPRPGEINGVDYTFLSVEEFMQLERDGSLLESGVYAGNHYGTPKPWARLTRGVVGGGGGGGPGGDMSMSMEGHHLGGGGSMEGLLQHHNSMIMAMEGGAGGVGGTPQKGPLLPGMHPSSEGKRRRNRSNVEALGAGGGDDEGGGGGVPPPMHSPPGGAGGGGGSGGVELGPLPANWEMAYTDNGEVYFIDHNTGTSHWLDPRLSRVQKLSLEDCTEDELPFGWERIEDPHYGVYYIDHVNRRTQFENPVIAAKAQQQHQNPGVLSKGPGGSLGQPDRNGNNGGMSTDSEADSTSKFLPTSNSSQDHHHHHHHHLPPPHQPPPQPPQHHHLHPQYFPPSSGGSSMKRPQSLSKPVPPVPNPKPQNPNRLSMSQQQQRTKTPVNEIMDGGHHHSEGVGGGGPTTMLPAFPSNSSAGSSGGLRVKPVHHQDSHGRPSYRFFTREPAQLIGERIMTTLVKSNRGLGFTIVGGDDDDGLDEFLQIKSVVTDGPAWNDGKLRTGDVLVQVNGTCVLGYTHQEMVSIFQSISPGEDVQLEVCRGYPLPFDPADPNTEIVTTVAVAPISDGGANEHHSHLHPHQKKHVDWAMRPASPADSLTHSAHSLPELSNDRERLVDFGKHGGNHSALHHHHHQHHRPASVDLLLDSPKGHHVPRFPFLSGSQHHPGLGEGSSAGGAAVLIVNIVKGAQGFGFTIADSVTGQKVKKVLDQSHCGELEEGDRLIALDGLDLRGLSHTQVVQILKDFPVGREASLTIQRTPPNSPYNHGGGGGLATRFFGAGGGYPPSTGGTGTRSAGISPRSKTPTAELARGRPRMRDNLPERPKTPQGGMVGDGGRSEYNGLFNGVDGGGGNSLFHPHSYLSDGIGGNGAANGGDPHGTSMGVPSSTPGGGGNAGDLSFIEMLIELQRRQEGFGFRIVGGTEEGSQVSVGHIVPGGAAALDGRLQTGDQLTAVEGCSVIGASHHNVVQLMARSATQGKVRLTVRRPVYGGGASSDTTAVVVTPVHSPGGGGGSIAGASIGSGSGGLPIHVTLRRQPSEGFGFVIISSASKAGATIGKIVEGSPADRCGELHVGDRILAVNQLDISQLHHTQVVQLIKESGFMLTLSVLPVMGAVTTPTTPTGGPPTTHHLPMSSPGSGGGTLNQHHQLLHHPQQPHPMHHGGGGGAGSVMTSGVVDTLENLSLKDGSQPGDITGTAFISPEGHPIQFGSHGGDSAPTTPGGGGNSAHEQVFSVHLSRGNRGFGFSIRGGKEFQNMPLFVLRLADDGPAAMDGRMLVGDQILQINGMNTHGMTHAQAIHFIKTGGASVHLLLRRGSVPFPFLNQIPNLTSGGFGVNGGGPELEEQSLSNASNNNSSEPQFITQSQSAAQLYRDHHHHHAGF